VSRRVRFASSLLRVVLLAARRPIETLFDPTEYRPQMDLGREAGTRLKGEGPADCPGDEAPYQIERDASHKPAGPWRNAVLANVGAGLVEPPL